MDLWAIASLAGLVASGIVAAYIVVRVPRTPTRLPFVLLVAAFAIWDLGEAGARLAPATDPATLLHWIRFQWIGISLTSGTFLHFALNFVTGRPLRERPWRMLFVYAVSVVVTFLVVATDTLVAGVGNSPTGPVALLGPAYVLGAIGYEVWFVLTFAILFRAYLRSASPDFRRRSRSVVLVLAVAGALASSTETLWPFLTGAPGNLGLASIYMLMITVGAAVSEARYHFLEIEAVTEATPSARLYALRPGLSHLFLSEERDPAFVAFREIVATTPGLCISAVHPRKLQERFGLERTPILWVTAVSGTELSVRPQGLEFELYQSAARFVKENPATVVLVDDVDFLVHTNGFDAAARFLHRLNNLATGRGSTTIAAVDPGAFTEAQITLLRGLFDDVREVPPATPFVRPALDADSGAVLLEGDADAALSVYESLASGDRGVLLTTKNPARLRRRLGTEAAIMWVGSFGEATEVDGGPVAIDLEAGKLATGLLRDRERPVLFLTDLEQFRLFAPFPRVLEFVKTLIDHVANQQGLLLASVAPKGMCGTELASLRHRFDRTRAL